MKPFRVLACCTLLIFAILSPANIRAATNYSDTGARSYYAAHDWDGLLRYATAWSQAEPSNASPLDWLAGAYHEIHRPDLEAKAYERFVQLMPNDAMGWNALGAVDSQLNRYVKAVSALTHAVRLAPGKINYWIYLASADSWLASCVSPGLRLCARDRAAAIKALQDGRRYGGPSARSDQWYNLGNSFADFADFDDAASAYKQAAHMNPGDGNAWNNLGWAESWRGNNTAALHAYQRASALGNQAGAKNYYALQQWLSDRSASNTASVHYRRRGNGCGIVSDDNQVACNNAGGLTNYEQKGGNRFGPPDNEK